MDDAFDATLGSIWRASGQLLVRKLIEKLERDEAVKIGNVTLVRTGAWIDESWNILGWKAKPRLVPWTDLKTYRTDGSFYLQSVSDSRLRSQHKFNDVENALVLDEAIRFLFRNDNWRALQHQ
ncbi:hypothetical protein ACQR09_27850 [Bradyrhizobium oligotrophicum]|uniref:hypothetical protein n=1 Tax=Bradyrhizobium oligotrophicum TaxID=44255 RepID=UPI003EB6B561